MRFRITFGQQYRHTAHPVLGYMPKLPDGWVTVDGADENDARNVANALIGQAWAFIYPDDSDTFGEEFYPRGCLGRLEDLVPKRETTTVTFRDALLPGSGFPGVHVTVCNLCDCLVISGGPKHTQACAGLLSTATP